MSTTNYHNQEAIKKLKEIAEDARFCMMSTDLDSRPIPTRPMTLQEVDDDGIMWFISGKDSDKNYELKEDAETLLSFSNPSKNQYLSVYGKAEIYTDQDTIDEHWSAMANAWFDGKTDPEVSIIGIRPSDVRFWDTKHGKIVDMALMLYTAVTGNGEGTEGGVEGKLEI